MVDTCCLEGHGQKQFRLGVSLASIFQADSIYMLRASLFIGCLQRGE